MPERLLPRPVPLGLSREEAAARVTVVYVITSPSGKQYVGITNQKPSRRWVQHASKAMAGHGPRHPFCCAIRKYGRKAFTLAVLETCPSDEAAQAAEIRWIAELQTVVPLGYNLSLGGDHNGAAGVASREARRLEDPDFDRHIRDSKKKSARTREARRIVDPEFDAYLREQSKKSGGAAAAAVMQRRHDDPSFDVRFREKKRQSLVAARAKQAELRVTDPEWFARTRANNAEASRAVNAAIAADPKRSVRRSARIIAAKKAIQEDPDRRAQLSLNHKNSWTPERRAASRERALAWNERRWHGDGK